METKSCKLTHNVNNPVIIECMWDIIFSTIDKDLVSKDLLVEIQKKLKLYSFVFTEFCLSEEDQMHLISVAEIYCGENEKYIPQFDKIIQILYKAEIITDKNVIKWGEKANESIKKYKPGEESDEFDDFDDELDQIGFENRVKFVENMKKFLEFLSKEDSSSSSSEESSSDDDKKSSSDDEKKSSSGSSSSSK